MVLNRGGAHDQRSPVIPRSCFASLRTKKNTMAATMAHESTVCQRCKMLGFESSFNFGEFRSSGSGSGSRISEILAALGTIRISLRPRPRQHVVRHPAIALKEITLQVPFEYVIYKQSPFPVACCAPPISVSPSLNVLNPYLPFSCECLTFHELHSLLLINRRARLSLHSISTYRSQRRSSDRQLDMKPS